MAAVSISAPFAEAARPPKDAYRVNVASGATESPTFSQVFLRETASNDNDDYAACRALKKVDRNNYKEYMRVSENCDESRMTPEELAAKQRSGWIITSVAIGVTCCTVAACFGYY